ncbi:MATE family multidrug resistance protein [Cryptococcus wingfieldii CBS 7118]|uniref:MATE family multidrug resistance protein n=1 Tax=Cryptococcus wingfieldii CBS 7118 TaxID=1295528 RepID=A0A1E3JYC3_9TREE|nr:MATE family multidrug resistance protein [Cryptococcus wingfieldii CBS 7118]ODO05207.1 MATE family multidrug resistance protein [Cryptococcus wingfieldii CBS 7118]
MSNFPHSAAIATSLSTSPYAVQSSLETLINRSRTHPHPHRVSGGDLEPPSPTALTHDHEEAASATPARRRPSNTSHAPRVGTIQEASYEDALIFQDDDDLNDEQSKLLPQGWKTRRGSRQSRRSYGATSAPLGAFTDSTRRHRSMDNFSVGTSRSRSKAQTPPRQHVEYLRKEGESSSDDDSSSPRRGRTHSSRPLSRTSFSSRRYSTAIRLGNESSADEGGDLARGLLATGGHAVFAGSGRVGELTTMDLDPVTELDAVDLEVPVDEDGKEVREWQAAIKAEFPVILRLALPVFFTQMAEWSLVLASVISIGHLGTADLAASSLASMTASVSCFSILQGLATALDTLLPAAWTSSDPSRVGLWTQRMFVVMGFAMIPMYVLWWNITPILIQLGQEPDVAQLAGTYLRWLSIGIPGYGGNMLVKKYLQAQNLMHVPTYTLFIVAPLNLFLNWLLVWGPEPVRLGFAGGALSTALAYNSAFLISLLWVIFYGPREAFHPIRFKYAFSKLGTCTSLGLAGTIMLSSEWWAWEACALAASILGPVTLAAQSVLLSTASTFFQVPASLGIASAVRVGNLLGAGRAWEAKWASRACLILSKSLVPVFEVLLTLYSSLCIIFRKNWGYMFNNDPEVVELVASIMPYIALFQIADGVAATAGSVLRSLGLHATGALINLTSYYIIGLPFGLWLAFTPTLELGLIGLWVGLSVALMYASLLSALLVWRANWPRAVERVRERLGLETHGQVGADGKWDRTEEHEEVGEGTRLLE